MYHKGRSVRTEYTATRMRSRMAVMMVIVRFTGMRNATRPPKKNSREAWRRSGMISTTVCILNRLRP
jgi:hypothetical protein